MTAQAFTHARVSPQRIRPTHWKIMPRAIAASLHSTNMSADEAQPSCQNDHTAINNEAGLRSKLQRRGTIKHSQGKLSN